MERVFVHKVSKHVGEKVTLKGWVYNSRRSGKIGFLTFRDGFGLLQCIVVKNDIVTDASFLGSGCAISTASASILTETIKGLKRIDIEELFREFHNLVTGEDSDAGAVGKFSVFGGVREYPARVKCATLSWHALMAALEGEKEASTE